MSNEGWYIDPETKEAMRPLTEVPGFYLDIYLADGTIAIQQTVSRAVPRREYVTIANGLKFVA